MTPKPDAARHGRRLEVDIQATTDLHQPRLSRLVDGDTHRASGEGPRARRATMIPASALPSRTTSSAGLPALGGWTTVSLEPGLPDPVAGAIATTPSEPGHKRSPWRPPCGPGCPHPDHRLAPFAVGPCFGPDHNRAPGICRPFSSEPPVHPESRAVRAGTLLLEVACPLQERGPEATWLISRALPTSRHPWSQHRSIAQLDHWPAPERARPERRRTSRLRQADLLGRRRLPPPP